jgi:hypothetical protein
MTDNSPVHSSDPLSTLLRAPGNVIRIAILVLAAAALVLPGFEAQGSDLVNRIALLTVAPLSLIWLFPLIVAVALVMTAVPAVSRYVRLADLAAAIAGLVFSGLAFAALGQLQANARAGEQLLGRYEPDGVWSATFQPGAYALMAATALAIFLLVAGGRRFLLSSTTSAR